MLIIGLGNPTMKYKNTLHNMGYNTVDLLAKKLNKKFNNKECDALTAVFDKSNEKIIIAKPLTYMNNSGRAIRQLMSKYRQKNDDLIVIYDDIDIPRFSVRVRQNGSAGTHNGMRNIVALINSEDFKRIRIGIGKNDYDLVDYVLSKIPFSDKKQFSEVFDNITNLLVDYINDMDFEKLMREANKIK